VVLVAALAGPAAGQDPTAYTIKLRPDQPGDKTQITKTDRKRQQLMGTINGMAINKDGAETEAYAFTETIVERPDLTKPPTKVVRDYTTAEVTKDGTARALPYAGKTVVIEKGERGYTFTTKDGAGIAGADAQALQTEFAKATSEGGKYLPKGPVKVGEPWKIDIKALAAFDTAPRYDLDKSTAMATLTKVYKKGGAQYGVIELNMAMVMTGDAEGTVKMTGSIDTCIDGSANDGKMTMKAGGTLTIKVPNGGTVKLTLEMDGEETHKPVK
jgi:hypothetical protein